jgi:hypothetical protein
MVFSNNLLMGAAGQSSGYEIEQSIRFDKTTSSHLSKTYGSAGNRRTWTFSTWFKRGKIDGTRQILFAATGQAYLQVGPDAASREMITILNEGSGTDLNWYTTQVFRDPSAWYHLVWQFDSTQATADDRTKLYINGSQVTDFTKAATPAQNFEGAISNAVEHKIGEGHTAANYFDGYQAEINFIDGTALDATSFGEYNDDGVWIPKAYTNAAGYGTNGFYITGETASDLGEDFSGNGNDFTSSGLATTDQMLDTPTLNWCTWNNIDTSFNDNVTSDGNLVITTASPGYTRFQLGTIGVSSGKWEWKWTPTASLSDGGIGVDDGTSQAATGASSGAFSSQSANGVIYRSGGTKLVGGTASSYGATFAAGDVIRCQIDLDAGTPTIEFFKNDVSQGSINMNAGVTYFPCQFSADAGLVTVADFGQSGFTAAAGFNTLNTANLATPSITDGSAHFDTSLWTGNDTDGRAITGYNFQPDWVWIKSRSGAYSHNITDAVRGAGIYLQSNTSDQEVTGPGAFGSTLAFTSDGFTLDNGTSDNLYVNAGGETYVGWAWNANGAGSSNTDGDITSTVSANTTAGFSIATYTGNALSSQTIGHGLGQIPSLVMFKELDSSSYSWQVYHASLGYTQRLILDGTNAAISATNIFSAAPTSTVFTVGNSAGINTNSASHVMYSFAEIPGYSSFGSYTGNGSTDGPFVYTGFTPRYVLFKRTNAAESWPILDTARGSSFGADAGTGGDNPTAANDLNAVLVASTGAAEEDNPAGSRRASFNANGFKVRTTNTAMNGSGSTYIYMAFAENPFGGDGVAPATAR